MTVGPDENLDSELNLAATLGGNAFLFPKIEMEVVVLNFKSPANVGVELSLC